MSFLDHLTALQKENLIGLPYRVGLKVSRSDSSGGNAADDQEMKALSNILHGYAAEIFGSETVQYIISETISHKERWPEWSKNLEKVEDECKKAVQLLSEVVDEKEVSAFKRHLLEIGESVAMAYREYNSATMPFLKRIYLYLAFLSGRRKATRAQRAYQDFEQFLNISLHERRTLQSIAGALKMTYI